MSEMYFLKYFKKFQNFSFPNLQNEGDMMMEAIDWYQVEQGLKNGLDGI